MVLLYTTLAAGLSLLTSAAAQSLPSDIVGTWSTKSGKVLTGPDFYDAKNDTLIEPSRTGISYSFTADGFYEEAYYRAIANPTDPKCPSGIMQWQHGSWERQPNGSLTLTPIARDGRQLMSTPCKYKTGIYTRYNQTEMFERYEVITDPYHNVLRLNLYEHDGTPMQPMYIAAQPPEMLPTTTLDAAASTATSEPKAKRTAMAKRGLSDDPYEIPMHWRADNDGRQIVTHINADRLWWIGVGMTGLGGILYLGPRRMGLSRARRT